ncbi:TonB-dependent receptor [Cellvibrio mixtus]|uniref:TonB-dependent receptor n=1 Tax=Cellvibrio mixtus TaxID=39650 RepID=UPI000587D8D7|nr:TonB-dependent receptor [Cellvibrio mixtus]
MRKFALNPIVLAMAVAALPAGVYAQEAGDETVEEVLVTGSFRDSLANAMNIKKSQTGFVDAIVASDIAEFPDNNLAESLQRVPGVAIQRSGGEGRGITVRGLGPTFTTVRLNGMETVSTTGGTDAVGGNNRGRGFDFNTFSSDLFSSLTVRKTNSAEIQEGSLGATVDLKAAQPFDYEGFVFTAAGQLGYNDLSEKTDPGGSFLVSNIFADGKFGALFSLSYSERDVKDEGSSTVRWSNQHSNRFKTVKGQTVGALGAGVVGVAPNPNDFDVVNGPCLDTDNNASTACTYDNRKFAPRIPRYDSFEHTMERLGSSLSLQFRPTDTTEISVDGLWAKFDATRQEVFLQASMNPGTNVTGGNLLDYEVRGNTLVYADIEGTRLLSENRFDDMSTDFSQGTITLKQDFTDSFRMKALVGTTKSDYDNPIQNTVIMEANNQRFTYDYRDYDNPKLIFDETAYAKTSWKTNGVRQRPQSTVNENDAASLAFEYDFNDHLKFKIGADYKDFSFNTNQFVLTAGEGVNGVDILSNPDFIVEYDSGLGDGQPWLIPNRGLIMDSYKLFDAAMTPNYGSTYEVGEETTGAYVQADFNFDIGSVPVRGDIGVRRFDTDQTSSGWLNANTANRSYITVEHDYSDTLPALNLSVEPISDLFVRASYSEGISRAGLGSIVPAVNVSVAGTNRTITGANPILEPTKAKSYDLGVEWYFAEEGLLGLTLFKKEIESHVQTVRTQVNYLDTGLPAEAAVNACASAGRPVTECNTSVDWSFSAPVNGPGGDLDGYEISYQQPFTFLPGFWSNFGFIGSFTHVESDLDYLNAAGLFQKTRPLVGLSDETYAATIYYENDKFNGRVSLANRSSYLTTPVGREGNDEEGTNSTTNIDASFGYQVSDRWKVTLEALNLTDEVDDQWVGSESEQRLSYYHATGRQFNLGVQYKFN